MGAETHISWTDHTFNPWIGCTKVDTACTNCYAETYGDRFGVEWGRNAARRRTSESNWRQPLAWDRAAQRDGAVRLVFCASLADVFDPEVPEDWRLDLWDLIRQTRNLRWLLLTKRPQHILSMLTPDLHGDPRIWLGTTVGHQGAVERARELAECPAEVLFLSCEPLVAPVTLPDDVLRDVSWIICGGESGAGARPMHPAWVRTLRDQALATETPFHFKQWGEWLPKSQGGTFAQSTRWGVVERTGEFFADTTPWNGHDDDGPDAGAVMFRVGKREAGRLLDGCLWDGRPTP